MRGRPVDHAGKRYGRLVALERVEGDAARPRWRCRCDCGAETVVSAAHLCAYRAERAKRGMACAKCVRVIDRTGVAYGRLLALECVGKRGERTEYFWRCRCDPALGGCGRHATVSGYQLGTGKTRSCGCISVENSRRNALLASTRRRVRPQVPVVGPDDARYESISAAAAAAGVPRATLYNWLRIRNAAGVSPHGWRRAV